MTARKIASLFIRLVGCYALIQAIPPVIAVTGFIASNPAAGRQNILPVLIPALVSFIGSLVLLALAVAFSEWFATRIVSEDNEVSLTIGNLSSRDIQSIAFSWLGIIVLLEGITKVIYRLSYYDYYGTSPGLISGSISFDTVIRTGVVANILEFIVGIVLFIYPRGMSNLWHAIQRTKGMSS